MTWTDDNAAWLAAARKHWAPVRRDQLLIRSWLSQPIAWDGYDQITLEGGLQSVVCSLETGRMPDDVFCDVPRDVTLEESDIQIPIFDIPMAVGNDRSLPIACISSGWFSPEARLSERWIRKRPRAEHYNAKKVNLAMDWSKAANTPKATVTANYLEFWAIGDAELLRMLLVDLPNLSSARSSGMGNVLGWELEINGKAEHWPCWQDKDGRVRRAMPHGLMINSTRCDVREATIRAPYWHKRTQMLCDVPIQEVGSVS
jgi:hypothetical protein